MLYAMRPIIPAFAHSEVWRGNDLIIAILIVLRFPIREGVDRISCRSTVLMDAVMRQKKQVFFRITVDTQYSNAHDQFLTGLDFAVIELIQCFYFFNGKAVEFF